MPGIQGDKSIETQKNNQNLQSAICIELLETFFQCSRLQILVINELKKTS